MNVKMEMQGVFTNDTCDDIIIWDLSNFGQYSTKSVYLWLLQQEKNVLLTEETWTWIWKLKLPENVRHFVWLVMHDSLPTNRFRYTRHVTLDPSCQRCGVHLEYALHTLRDFPQARHIWNTVGYRTSHSLFLNVESRD